jgi:hypothetical protein
MSIIESRIFLVLLRLGKCCNLADIDNSNQLAGSLLKTKIKLTNQVFPGSVSFFARGCCGCLLAISDDGGVAVDAVTPWEDVVRERDCSGL